MTFAAGLGLFFVLLVGGLLGGFLWLWLLERREVREQEARLAAVDAERLAHHERAVATARNELAALSPEAIRARLRLGIGRKAAQGAGLSTPARSLTETIDCRLVVDGISVRGLTPEARARLEEDDDTLFSLAASQSLDVPPTSPGRAPLAWLAELANLLPGQPAVLAAAGSEVRWIAPPTRLEALADLACQTAPERGELDGCLLFWDGATLVDIRRYTPTLRGPTTPDFVLDLPPALCALTGLPARPSFRRD
jgi:hypothetical protein